MFDAGYVILAVVGSLAGAFANHLISTYAYFTARPISPWTRPGRWTSVPKKFRPDFWPDPLAGDWWKDRTWADRIPVVGWLRLRRETPLHGNGFWIRPLLIEIAMAIGLPWLYYFEAASGGLLPEIAAANPAFLQTFQPTGSKIFVAHAILLTWMVAATFIDLDERTIPDIITIPGTWVGLIAGTISTGIFLPTSLPIDQPVQLISPTTFDSPWYAAGSRWLGPNGLLAAIAIWTVWCFALADRRWSGVMVRRRGLARALRHFTDVLFHSGNWKRLVAMWFAGLLWIIVVSMLGGSSWRGLFSSLVGLAVGGGVVWAIRIVASLAVNKEAMGFGDVTLMAMIGTYVGWQASLSAFFLAPFTAIVIVVVQYFITRESQLPFGPYLCAGTLLTILCWDDVYNDRLALNLLTLGQVLLWIGVAMLGLMGGMLLVWRNIKLRLIYRDPSRLDDR